MSEKKSEQKLKQEREQELNDLRVLLNTPEGKRFIWRYISKCGVFKTSFTGNSTTFYLEGARNIGLSLLAEVMEARPEAYLEMSMAQKGANDVN